VLGRAFAEYEAKGGGLVSVTLTVRHGADLPLSVLWRGLTPVFNRAVCMDRSMVAFRRAHPFEYVRGREVTFGELNGWHPHLHLALLTLEPWSSAVLAEFRSTLFDSWYSACEWAGLPLPSPERGVHAERASGSAVGEYLTKAAGLGSELVRSDIKRGRGGSWSPFELLAAAAGGDGRCFALWREYEDTTLGAHALDFSGAARAVLGIISWETDDEAAEFVEADEGRLLLGVLDREEWHGLIHRPGGWERLMACECSEDLEGLRVACRGDPPWWWVPTGPGEGRGVRREVWRFYDGVEGFSFD
jgi:hypothetical protein